MEKRSFFKTADYKKRIIEKYDTVLESWPAPRREHLLPTRYGETFVLESGNPAGPALILLHGSGSNSSIWRNGAELFGGVYRVLAVDIPGDPGKSEELRAPWEADAYSTWMEDIYAGLKISEAALAGISIGGWIATRWATGNPGRVSALVLLSASGFARPKTSFFLKALLFSLLGEYGLKKIQQLIFNRKTIEPEVESYFLLMARGYSPRQGVPPIFSDAEIRQLTMPLFYLGGDADVLIDTRGSMDRINSLLTSAETELLPGMGHAVIGAEEKMLEFLQRNR